MTESVVDPQEQQDDTPAGPGSTQVRRTRWMLAKRFLHGNGVEVGALHMPLAVPETAKVTFVDRMSVEDLRHHYPELAELDLVPVDVVDDGEGLSKFESESQDFVIANHFIEHTESPIKTIESHMRVLKPGGVIYMAVPDKRHTFDVERELTSVDHLVRDYREGPEWSRHEHFRDFAIHVHKATGSGIEEETTRLEEMDYSIHFHVWEPATFVEMLVAARSELNNSFEIEAMHRNEHEFIVVLSKVSNEPVAGDAAEVSQQNQSLKSRLKGLLRR